MPTKTEEAAEAICGALHEFEFEFLGETRGTELDSGLTTWWTRGRKPQNMRVCVIRADPFVRVNIEWPVLKPPRVIKGEVVINIDTRCDKAKLFDSTHRAVQRCLEVYLDVLGQTGLASPEAAPDGITRPFLT